MNYHNITHDDMNNGDGLRVVLWVAGCDHHCKNCQNPITWDVRDGVEFDKAAFREICTELAKPYISGLTFSGGDPLQLFNRYPIYSLARTIKRFFPDKTIWLYTGYTWEEIIDSKFLLNDVLKYVDVLVDGRFEEELKDVSYHWAGSTNQRVIDVQKSLKEGRVILHDASN